MQHRLIKEWFDAGYDAYKRGDIVSPLTSDPVEDDCSFSWNWGWDYAQAEDMKKELGIE